ncbi:MAG: SPFH domain-containing protein [bacterium]|nr:SPFH domain-containing protein [bacterium]
MSITLIALLGIALAVLLVASLFLAVLFRRVVSTNMMHIVQTRRDTTPYGTGQDNGNVYYRWPRWVPYFGVTVIELPVSNFDLKLQNYEAYDKDRVPFMVDVASFFRIADTARAAQRVETIPELENQLTQVVQGAVRKVLASDVIDVIMLERAQFGKQFTDEVEEQLKEWGVEPVKSMELMDIRDTPDSKVIHNIMAKKTSHIEKESRTEVARNMQAAQTAEIEAKQAVDIRGQEAEQMVGERTAEKDKAVGIANQQARQEVLTQERETATRNMAVKQVEQVREAEITREQQVVAADQDKQTQVIRAEGFLAAQEKEAAAIKVVGDAKGAAEQAMLMAPVNSQIALAKEIGTNPGYQQYLAMIKAIEAYLEVGGKQAEALQAADVKVIANTGKPTEGMRNVMDLFTSKGGTDLASMIEALAQTPLGKAALAAVGVQSNAPVETSAEPSPAPETDKEVGN